MQGREHKGEGGGGRRREEGGGGRREEAAAMGRIEIQRIFRGMHSWQVSVPKTLVIATSPWHIRH